MTTLTPKCFYKDQQLRVTVTLCGKFGRSADCIEGGREGDKGEGDKGRGGGGGWAEHIFGLPCTSLK